MKRNLMHIGCGVLFSIAATGAVMADTLLENGGFEDPLVVNSRNWAMINNLPGWEISKNDDFKILNSYNDWRAAEGDQWAELNDAAIYQTIDVTPGAAYKLEFAYAPLPGDDSSNLKIKWSGATLDVVKADGYGLGDLDWMYASYVVTADSPVASLEIRDLGKAAGVYIDDISLTDLARVPEPAGVSLLLVGAVALLRRRQ